ncbi:uncharacterized protein LOC115876367 [Sitophilus oryzae]|uniref:Uncharacterized protein LOC115876367 n=1 Tax=Sitophilus oryzae TaxID=7048 RepID=A0A6J2XAI0_SITOR|nr:uncharacterized protein LOC115876367 [Sitophilus oryzae]
MQHQWEDAAHSRTQWRRIKSAEQKNKLLLVIAFIDFQKAFDLIYSKTIIEALAKQGTVRPFIGTLANIHKEAKARVMIYKQSQCSQLAKEYDTETRYPQTCLNNIKKSSVNWTGPKILKLDEEYLNYLRYADDIVLIANSPEELQT